MAQVSRVVVAGGGIGGLTVALWLRDGFLAHVPPPKLEEVAAEMAAGR
jgi:glycine/D-amino acid oxidase-like deaminating enzyme